MCGCQCDFSNRIYDLLWSGILKIFSQIVAGVFELSFYGEPNGHEG